MVAVGNGTEGLVLKGKRWENVGPVFCDNKGIPLSRHNIFIGIARANLAGKKHEVLAP